MSKIFKIQRESDGLFSNGGARPQFTKHGKTWSHRGYVDRHLQQVSDPSVYNGSVLVEFDMGLVACYELMAVPTGRIGETEIMVMPEDPEEIAITEEEEEVDA